VKSTLEAPSKTLVTDALDITQENGGQTRKIRFKNAAHKLWFSLNATDLIFDFMNIAIYGIQDFLRY
jgi:hypothetical protein